MWRVFIHLLIFIMVCRHFATHHRPSKNWQVSFFSFFHFAFFAFLASSFVIYCVRARKCNEGISNLGIRSCPLSEHKIISLCRCDDWKSNEQLVCSVESLIEHCLERNYLLDARCVCWAEGSSVRGHLHTQCDKLNVPPIQWHQKILYATELEGNYALEFRPMKNVFYASHTNKFDAQWSTRQQLIGRLRFHRFRHARRFSTKDTLQSIYLC